MLTEANIVGLLVNGGGFAVIGVLLWKLVINMVDQNKSLNEQNRISSTSQSEQNKTISSALTNHLQHQLFMQEKYNEAQSEIRDSLREIVNIMSNNTEADIKQGKKLNDMDTYIRDKLGDN